MIEMTEKRYILSHNGKEDGILDKTNDKGYYGFELARLVNELSEENERLKQQNEQAINLILDGIMEMHDGKRDYAETLFNKAIKVIKNDT